jgi:predicted Zn-dependent protease
MSVPPHLILRVAACLSAACLSASCNTSDARAQQALEAYQAAAAQNDLITARVALLNLVRAKDDVSEYWVELGKVQASLGSFGDAYYAFSRAYELDRGNAQLLSVVTQLALRSGDIALAQRRAKDLEVLAPSDPWVKLTAGWAAISQSRFDDAIAASDTLLQATPFDPSATVLKARALIGQDREPEAVELLKKQVQAQPSDAGSLDLLARAYERRSDWQSAAAVALQLQNLTPTDRNNSLLLIKSAFLANNVTLGRAASQRLLQPNAETGMINAVLDLWTSYWPSPERLQEATRLATKAQGLEQKLVYAAFLNRMGRPAEAIRLSSAAATLPVNAGNAEANAVLADALSRTGKLAEARSRLDAVIAFDPGNATALRSRAELQLQTGDAAAAVIDAEKLVTVLPQSATDRLLLARAFTAADKSRWADRTLWSAFQDIPGDERIYAALAARRKGNSDAIRELQEEFARQRDKKLGQGLL